MRRRRFDLAIFVVALLLSFLGHIVLIGGLGAAARRFPREHFRSMEFAVIEPPPPPPPTKPDKKKLPPPPPPVEPIELPPAIDVTPPPNTAEPPKDAKPSKPVFGITMSSVVGPGSGSGFSVRVGNTLMIQPDDDLTPADQVKPLAAKPVALHKVTKMPERVGKCQVGKDAYPAEASAMGVEGQVRLLVEIAVDGSVGEVSVIEGLGYGLDEAAVNILRTKCRFKPAMLGDQAVPTQITYTFTFVLED